METEWIEGMRGEMGGRRAEVPVGFFRVTDFSNLFFNSVTKIMCLRVK